MTPYYDEGGITIYHGDCVGILASLPRVNLVLTSPPYNLGRSSGTQWGRLKNGYQSYDDDRPHDEYRDWQRFVLRACWQLLTADGAIFYQHKPIAKGNNVRLPFDLLPPELPLRQIITWDKVSAFQRTHWHFVPRYEWLLVIAKEAFRLKTLDVADVWRIYSANHPNTPRAEKSSDHPAAMAVALARRVIASSDVSPGLAVLDPFMGSGTTLRAAKDLGKRAIGIEIEERYCEIAARRLAQEVLAFGSPLPDPGSPSEEQVFSSRAEPGGVPEAPQAPNTQEAGKP